MWFRDPANRRSGDAETPASLYAPHAGAIWGLSATARRRREGFGPPTSCHRSRMNTVTRIAYFGYPLPGYPSSVCAEGSHAKPTAPRLALAFLDKPVPEHLERNLPRRLPGLATPVEPTDEPVVEQEQPDKKDEPDRVKHPREAMDHGLEDGDSPYGCQHPDDDASCPNHRRRWFRDVWCISDHDGRYRSLVLFAVGTRTSAGYARSEISPRRIRHWASFVETLSVVESFSASSSRPWHLHPAQAVHWLPRPASLRLHQSEVRVRPVLRPLSPSALQQMGPTQ